MSEVGTSGEHVKRKEQHDYRGEIYTGTVYLDELEAVVEIATEQGYEVQLRDRSYEYSDLDEMAKENPHGLTFFELQVRLPDRLLMESVFITIEHEWTYVRTPFAKPETRALAMELQSVFIEDKRTRYLPIFAALLPAVAWVVAVIVALTSQQRVTLFTPSVILSLLASVVLALVLLLYWRNRKTVIFQHRRKVVGFWARYGREISFAVLGAVLTIIGGVIVYYLTR